MKILIRGLSALLLLVSCSVFAAAESGKPAPDFSGVAFTQAAVSQAKFSLSSLKGKVTYIDFWASWCAPCRQSFPVLDSMAKKFADSGFVVVGVNKDVQIKDAQKFLLRTPASFTLVHDADNVIAKAFDFKTMPTGFLVDRKGVVRYVHEGFNSESEKALQGKVEALLKE